jgi:PAS domain S-box-containing protein
VQVLSAARAVRPRGSLPGAWAWFLGVAAGAIAVSLAVGPVEFEPVMGAAATAAIVAGIRWHRPAAPRAWQVMAAAQGTVTTALVAWVSYLIIAHRPAPYPTVIDVVYMMSNLMFAAGLALFVRRRVGRSPWEGVLDAGLVTLGLAAVVWALVYAPYLDTSGVPPLVLLTALVYPIMDLLLLAMLTWLVFTAGLRTRSLMLIAAGFTMLFAADIIQASLAAHGGNADGNPVTLTLWALSYALVGAAALHPSMAQTVERDSVPPSVASSWRVVVYLCLAVTGPAVAIASVLAGDRQTADVLAPMALMAGIAVLLVIRLAQIARLAGDRAVALDRQAVELAQSREQVTAIFESAPTGMAQLAGDGTILAANPALARMAGRASDRLAGQRIGAFVHPDDASEARGLVDDTLSTRERQDREIRLRDGQGNTVWASWVASPVYGPACRPLSAIVVIADQTEARRLEIELRHAQKLEAVGRLAAGVAHELNTPIQFIGDNVDFLSDAASQLLMAAGDGNGGRSPAADGQELDYLAGEIPEAARQTRDGVRRVATIVQALKSFAHPDAPGQHAADLNQALTDTLTVARSELRHVGRVESDLGALPPVTCSVGDLNQVFLNLLVNAADAVAETQAPAAPGVITVRSRHAGDTVVIEVSDSGPGIPDEARDRVFEPFFTTKPVGRGTGQGLALARSVVTDQHGGTIGFTSAPGQGTTFTVTLPVNGLSPHIPRQPQRPTEPAYYRQP